MLPLSFRIIFPTLVITAMKRTRSRIVKGLVADIENCDDQPTTSTMIPKIEEKYTDVKKAKGMSDSMVKDIFKTPKVEARERMDEQISRIQRMRISGDAPVDTMGCHMLADARLIKDDPKTYRFQTLVALMLSSQTKDQVTSAAMERLKNYGLTIERMEEIPTAKLEALLVPVSFYKKKAIYLKKVAGILKDTYDSDVPATLDELCSLPGVGPKMANLALQCAWEKVEGIGVDTHVHRITNRLGWIKTKTPIETEKRLMELLPREQWSSINKLLVGFGQQICLPVKPKCSECLNYDICPSSTCKTKQ